jgi:transposase
MLKAPSDTVLLFEDECSLSNSVDVSYSWGKVGQQPVIACGHPKRERQTLFGSYNYQTGQIIPEFAPTGNTQTFQKHLKKVRRIYRDASKIIIVLDNARFHHAKKLRRWLEGQDQLELFFLPPYSPELNAIERAWWYMRKKITHNRWVKTMEERKIQFWKMFSHFQKPNKELQRVCVVNY